MHTGYHAPLDLYPEFHRIAKDPSIHTVPEGRPVSVCVGKEWHRFPSSFLLPNKWVRLVILEWHEHFLYLRKLCLFFYFVVFCVTSWQLQFIQSEFRGQLPKPFASGQDATRLIPTDMNDQNLEEPSRYVSAPWKEIQIQERSTIFIGRTLIISSGDMFSVKKIAPLIAFNKSKSFFNAEL